MVYRVNKFDFTKTPIDVQDATLNEDTHLTFVGKNWYGYGETIAENQLHLMENFAHTTKPDIAKAVEGQLHYNTIIDAYYYCHEDDVSKEWRLLPGSNFKSVVIQDTQGADHTVTIGYDYDMASDSQVVLCAFSTSATTGLTYIDVLNDPAINDQNIITGFDSKIHKGITMASNTEYKFHGTATTAQYADLAEMYHSDQEYEAGTVVKIGGEAEVTQTTSAFDPNVFGVVSTDPAYLMNSAAEGTTVPVALAGRVPVKCIGPVKKGQRLLSSEEPGVARAPTDYEMQEYMDWYRIVGRALEDKTTEGIGLVEVVVGVK